MIKRQKGELEMQKKKQAAAFNQWKKKTSEREFEESKFKRMQTNKPAGDATQKQAENVNRAKLQEKVAKQQALKEEERVKAKAAKLANEEKKLKRQKKAQKKNVKAYENGKALPETPPTWDVTEYDGDLQFNEGTALVPMTLAPTNPVLTCSPPTGKPATASPDYCTLPYKHGDETDSKVFIKLNFVYEKIPFDKTFKWGFAALQVQLALEVGFIPALGVWDCNQYAVPGHTWFNWNQMMVATGFEIYAKAVLTLTAAVDLFLLRAGVRAEITIIKLNVPVHNKYLTKSAPEGQAKSCWSVEPKMELFTAEIYLFMEYVCGFDFPSFDREWCSLGKVVLAKIGPIADDPFESAGLKMECTF